MNKINTYEYSSIICPGAILILGVLLFYSDGHEYLKNFDLGDLGLFTILSFCMGNILQGLANIFEDLIWHPKKITKKIFEKEKIKMSFKEIYLIVSKNGNIDRIDIFNKQYGLMRGLFISSFLLSLLSIIMANLFIFSFFVVVSLICIYRAVHFSKLYSKELAMEYKLQKNKIARSKQ